MTLCWAVTYGIAVHVIRRFRITCAQIFGSKDNLRFMLTVGTYIPDPTASHRENCNFSSYHCEKPRNPKFHPKTCDEGTGGGSRCIALLFLQPRL